MQDSATAHDVTVSKLVGCAISENCQEPTAKFGKIKANKEEDFNEFTVKLMECLGCAEGMDAVMERLKTEHITKPSVTADLYEVYKFSKKPK